MSALEPKDFADGYDAGRTMCLATGSRESAQVFQLLHRHEHGASYWDGWSWALWDYEDANGLPHIESTR